MSPPTISTDYCDTISKNDKKRISIAVSFEVSQGQNIRALRDVSARYGQDGQMVVEREWVLGPNKAGLVDNFRAGQSFSSLLPVDAGDRASILGFLQAFEFRYIPNHVRPSDVMRKEVQALRPKLISRLRKRKEYRSGNIDMTMEALSDVASHMFRKVDRGISHGGVGRTIRPDIPKDFADLAFQIGISAVTAEGRVQRSELQGSGTQSFMLLHVLDLLDSTLREQSFGWKQYSIWAIEEPESFLHARLRTRFAQDLRTFASDPRRQIIATTHQDEFVRVADNAWIMTLSTGNSAVRKLPARDALVESARLRITPYSHPLTAWPDDPVVIVEGKFDVIYLRAAAERAQLRPIWRLMTLSEMDASQSGGDNVKSYLQANRAVIASRAAEAPIFVLRDWEDFNRVEGIRKIIEGAHEWSTAWSCPVNLANPDLGDAFRGIERYLPTSFIEDHIPSDDLIPASVRDTYPLRISGDVLEANKARLARDFDSSKLTSDDSLVRLLQWIDERVGEKLEGIPPHLFI